MMEAHAKAVVKGETQLYGQALNELATIIHSLNYKWWVNLETGNRIERNIGELLMLTVSELAEALEGHRKSLQDDHLPHRKMFEVEIADCMIRLLDICGGLKLDVGGALIEKLRYNIDRPDHKPENRLKDGGKKY